MSIKPFERAGKALDELGALRDEGKLRLHLLSMEARQRWDALESTVDALERNLARNSEHASEAVVAKIRDAADAIREFMKNHAPPPAGSEDR